MKNFTVQQWISSNLPTMTIAIPIKMVEFISVAIITDLSRPQTPANHWWPNLKTYSRHPTILNNGYLAYFVFVWIKKYNKWFVLKSTRENTHQPMYVITRQKKKNTTDDTFLNPFSRSKMLPDFYLTTSVFVLVYLIEKQKVYMTQIQNKKQFLKT